LPASLVAGGGPACGFGTGNVPLIVLPVRGGGCDRSRSANACVSSGLAPIGDTRSRIALAAASSIAWVGGNVERSAAGAPALPSDSRIVNPGLLLSSASARPGVTTPLPLPLPGGLLPARGPHDETKDTSVATATQRIAKLRCTGSS
jgi:hypothetical protein